MPTAVDQVTALLREKWGTKTLSALRSEAAKELNGSLFESIREQNGQRLLLVMCLTGQHEIKILEKAVTLDKTGTPVDWKTTTVCDVVIRTMLGSGLSYEAEYDAKGQPSSVLLIVTHPHPMKLMERLFNLR
jgi:hypothetical protein